MRFPRKLESRLRTYNYGIPINHLLKTSRLQIDMMKRGSDGVVRLHEHSAWIREGASPMRADVASIFIQRQLDFAFDIFDPLVRGCARLFHG